MENPYNFRKFKLKNNYYGGSKFFRKKRKETIEDQ
jgi:hypothetical protein